MGGHRDDLYALILRNKEQVSISPMLRKLGMLALVGLLVGLAVRGCRLSDHS